MHAKTLIAAASLLLVSTTAWAQSNADTLYQQGVQAFSNGDYETAAKQFAAAYDADPDPVFQKSEAVAWFKAERCDEAIRAANAFLHKWEGASTEADEASSVVANCKVDLAEDAMDASGLDLAEKLLVEASNAARDEYTRDRITAAKVRLTKLRADEQAAKDADKPDTTVVVAPPPDPDPVEPRSAVPGIFVTSIGGAMIAGAAVLHIIGLTRTVPELEEARTGARGRHETLSNQLDTMRIVVPTLYTLGGLGVGVGVWMLIDRGEGDEQNPGEQTVGLTWSQRF